MKIFNLFVNKEDSKTESYKTYIKVYRSWWSLFKKYSNTQCGWILAFHYCTIGQGGCLKRYGHTRNKRRGKYKGTNRKQSLYYNESDNKIKKILRIKHRHFQKIVQWLKKEGFIIEVTCLNGEKEWKFLMPESQGTYVKIFPNCIKNKTTKISIQDALNKNKHPKIKGQYNLFHSQRTYQRQKTKTEVTKSTPYNPLTKILENTASCNGIKIKLFDGTTKEIKWYQSKKLRDCLITKYGIFKYDDSEREYRQVQWSLKKITSLSSSNNPDWSCETQEKLSEQAQRQYENTRQNNLIIHKRPTKIIPLSEIQGIRNKYEKKKLRLNLSSQQGQVIRQASVHANLSGRG